MDGFQVRSRDEGCFRGAAVVVSMWGLRCLDCEYPS
jgi:hypothetical protein